jgi:hypothetical protein
LTGVGTHAPAAGSVGAVGAPKGVSGGAAPGARGRGLRLVAIVLWVVEALGWLLGLLVFWATGFLAPEEASGRAEGTLLVLTPGLVLATTLWIVQRWWRTRVLTVLQVVVLAVGAVAALTVLVTG